MPLHTERGRVGWRGTTSYDIRTQLKADGLQRRFSSNKGCGHPTGS